MILAAGWLCMIASCRKQPDPTPLPLPGAMVTLTVHPTEPGTPIPANFTGFSYDMAASIDTTYLTPSNSVLVQLVANLGGGCLRIGGNSSDVLVWTGRPRNANTGMDSLASSDVDHFAAFAKAVGWPVIFGLNLGVYDTARAVSEAGYVSNSLGNDLAFFQIGNEPNDFIGNGYRNSSYSYANFQSEWLQYFTAIRRVLPDAPFSGPVVSLHSWWLSSFISAEHADIVSGDAHYYRTGPGSDPAINCDSILYPDPSLVSGLKALNTGLPYRISECNTVYGGGKTGVSDVFASALWALDFMWTVAENKGQGVEFHGSQTSKYAPIVMINGTVTPRPEYYALLAFHAAAHGNLVPVDADFGQLNASAYACYSDGVEYVIVVNKDTKNILFTIQPGMTAQTAQVLTLTAPGVTSADSVTFAGSRPDATGRFVPGMGTTFTPTQGNFIIGIPAGSAAVMVIK